MDGINNYDTRYAKSFRHLTREALPRLDNYRNILSIQAAYRPTLDELHNATLTVNKVTTGNERHSLWQFYFQYDSRFAQPKTDGDPAQR